MKKNILTILLFLSYLGLSGNDLRLESPGQVATIVFSLKDVPRQGIGRVFEKIPYYEVYYNDKLTIASSRLGFQIAGASQLNRFFEVTGVEREEHRGEWRPVYGQKSEYPDNYNLMRVLLRETVAPFRELHIVFRAYDEGISFRYEIPAQPRMKHITIISELTEFQLPANSFVWESYGHESEYGKVQPSEIKANCELPLTFFTPGGVYGAIMEAGNSYYPRAYISPSEESNMRITLRGEAKGSGDYTTAWRIISLSDRPGSLMEQSYLLYNHNEPCKITDTSWIAPGTAIRETSLSTPGAINLIDFAHAFGIDNIHFDTNWYGSQWDDRNNPKVINVVGYLSNEPPEGHPGLDLEKVLQYANEKDVGVWMYLNFKALDRYKDTILSHLHALGVRGIKPGFVHVGNQEWQQWNENLVMKASENQLMVNIHDAYRPTGFSRTYPNLLTQEGVMGNEHTPDANHNATLPFTRYSIGAADYTPGYCRETLQNTWVHRLALPVIYYSPAQFLFWGESITDCHDRPELAYWRNIPTTWDDTKVLDGQIGEFINVARQKKGKWYVAGITNQEPRSVTIDFSFLEKDMIYDATIYTDTIVDDNPDVKIRREIVHSGSSITFDLMPSGGFAIACTPQ